MTELEKWLESLSYENLRDEALFRADPRIDKRQGSILYDSIAPNAYLLELFRLTLLYLYKSSFVGTASGKELEMKVGERGLSRNPATKAKVKIRVQNYLDEYIWVPIGTTFTTTALVENQFLTYIVTEQLTDNHGNKLVVAECNTPGTIGNQYIGAVSPITQIIGFKKAYIESVYIPARNQETDEELRKRYFKRVEENSFGGNVAQYEYELLQTAGVGAVRIRTAYPASGWVCLFLLDVDYNPISNDFRDKLQEDWFPKKLLPTGRPETWIQQNPKDLNKQLNQIWNRLVTEGQTDVMTLGLAPIGQLPIFLPVTKKELNISVKVRPVYGTDFNKLSEDIKKNLKAWETKKRRSWNKRNHIGQYETKIYFSEVFGIIQNTENVSQSSEITINDTQWQSTSDSFISIAGSSMFEETILSLGTVTISQLE